MTNDAVVRALDIGPDSARATGTPICKPMRASGGAQRHHGQRRRTGRAPTEIFEVTEEIAEHADRFAKLISHEIPFTEVERAIQLALTPGASDKIVGTLP